MITIEDVISLSLEHSATDIHLEVGTPIYIRAANGLESISSICSVDMIKDVLQRCGVTHDEWHSVDMLSPAMAFEFGLIFIGLIIEFVEH